MAIYHIDLGEVKEWLRSRGFRRVLIQAPLGLRGMAVEISKELSGITDLVIVHGGSCWGGCDVAFNHAKLTGMDAIIHLGHSKFLQEDLVPTYYLECRYSSPLQLFKALENAPSLLGNSKRVGLGAVVQWQNFLGEVARKMKEAGFEPFVGSPSPPLRYEGQILGCSYNTLFKVADYVDSFILIGSKFHALGLALQTKKVVYLVDPEAGRIEKLNLEAEKYLRTRYAYIAKFKEFRRVGVIVSIKPGQYRLMLAVKLKKIIQESGKYAEILAMDDVLPDQLLDLPFDAFVNTACPRLSIDEQYRMGKPLLLPSEVLISVGELGWEEVIKTPKYTLMEVV